MKCDKDYVVALRRELHRTPEVGFDLDKTLGIVRRELGAPGIFYKYITDQGK